MARKVATPQEFDQAAGWGYSYFHGSFFSKPAIQPDKEISASKLVYLQVLNEVNQPELPYDELEDLIKQDVSLTYKLLRFMNSVWFGLRYEVRSIKHALVLLGPTEVRKWASLVVVGRTASDKPRELLLRSLSRARAGELLAPLIGMQAVAPELFLMGMFSVIDALVDMPLIDVLGKLPLNKNIKGALLAAEGPFKIVYDTIVAYEQGEWERFSSCAQTLGLDEGLVPDLFTTSLKWANNAIEAI
jgi:EAL and modified HD-GYP domain-containing signal transduction protein